MNYLVNAISVVTNIFTRFFTLCKDFFQATVDVFSGISSIISTLRFWLKTLLSWVWSLIQEVFNWSLFDYLAQGFYQLSWYVWFWGAVFISSILFVVLVRIVIAWVFKMFRLNQDYNTMKTKRK